MARLAKTVVAQREAEALAAFQAGSTVKEVNDALFLKHGKRMGLKRIYELKAQAASASVVAPVAAPDVVDAEVVAV
jgi:hypothetical protein